MRPNLTSLKQRIEEGSMPVPEAGCWIWMLCCLSRGYGRIRANGKTRMAHRISYQEFIEPIPNGLQVLHRCDTPSCVNPKHLFLGTQKDNIRDAVKKLRMSNQKVTHCPHGHEYTPENTHITRKKFRLCRECSRKRSRNGRILRRIGRAKI